MWFITSRKMTQFFQYILRLNYQIVANTNLTNTLIFKNVPTYRGLNTAMKNMGIISDSAKT